MIEILATIQDRLRRSTDFDCVFHNGIWGFKAPAGKSWWKQPLTHLR
jgi:hypothetical protein